jgi:NADPH:quinone reductase-like Zn-dependent oxidoreductase
MKAVVHDTYGTADVLRLQDIDQPVAGNADVVLRVYAAILFIGTGSS